MTDSTKKKHFTFGEKYIISWEPFDKIWLFVFLSVIIATTVYFSATGTDYANTKNVLLNWVISPISAISGLFCVVLAAKGKYSNWIWGVVNSLLYGYLAFQSGYYGDMIINLAYFLPTQFIGMIAWKRMMKQGSKTDVKMRRLTPWQTFFLLIGSVVATILLGLFLSEVNNWFTNSLQRNQSIYGYFALLFGVNLPLLGPIVDASTEVLQVLAQIFMILAYAEQWILWILTNVITIAMWIIVIIANPASVSWSAPTLIMWIAYLINSGYGFYNWRKGAISEAVSV